MFQTVIHTVTLINTIILGNLFHAIEHHYFCAVTFNGDVFAAIDNGYGIAGSFKSYL